MRPMMGKMEVHLTFLILGASLICAFPKNKYNFDSNREGPQTSQRTPNNVDTKTSQEVQKRPQFAKNVFSVYENTKDLIMYHENRDDGLLKCLCWAELFIITENNQNKEKNITNEYAIILESPGDIAEESLDGQEVETYTLTDSKAMKNRTLKFITVNKTEEFTIKEHKTLHCGAGPVLIKTIIEWPKANKQKIEIRLTPSTQKNKWQIFKEDDSVDPIVQYTPFPTSQTFDTTTTEDYSQTNSEDVTLSMHKSDDEIFNRNITIGHGNSTKSSNGNLVPKKEQDTSREDRKNTKKTKGGEPISASSGRNITVGGDSREMKRELLMRNLYFKKLSNDQSILNITKTDFLVNPEYDNALYFFDLIYPNKSTSFNNLIGGNHKFVINIQVTIEHVVIENVNGTEQETSESITEMEEESVYFFK